jgi:hypothetical protein
MLICCIKIVNVLVLHIPNKITPPRFLPRRSFFSMEIIIRFLHVKYKNQSNRYTFAVYMYECLPLDPIYKLSRFEWILGRYVCGFFFNIYHLLCLSTCRGMSKVVCILWTQKKKIIPAWICARLRQSTNT